MRWHLVGPDSVLLALALSINHANRACGYTTGSASKVECITWKRRIRFQPCLALSTCHPATWTPEPRLLHPAFSLASPQHEVDCYITRQHVPQIFNVRGWQPMRLDAIMPSQEGIGHRCAVCQFPEWVLDPNTPSGDTVEITRQQINDLQEHGGEPACPGCQILIVAYSVAMEWPEAGSVLRKFCLVREEQTRLSLRPYFDDNNDSDFEVDIFTLPGDPRLPGVRKALPIPPTTGLSTSMSQIRKWLDGCLENHQRCTSASDVLPVRLLDLEHRRNSVRVVDSSLVYYLTSKPRYVCLSHCWGNSRSLRLTKSDTLDANMLDIPLDELPKTFQDAVVITRALQIRYLWIDSLCIIQEHEEDWRTHISLMFGIYQNAYFTLAAGAASSDDGGFFRDAESRYTQVKSVRVSLDNAKTADVHFRVCPKHPYEWWTPGWPLTKRAWVLQEYLISPRLIAFGPHEVYWSCYEAASCSCSAAGEVFRSADDLGGGMMLIEDIKRRLSGVWPSTPQERYDHKSWHTLMEIYCNLLLSNVKDRLPAIAGLARMFQGAGSTGEYYEGAWKNSLERTIAWSCFGTSSQPKVALRPSWSFVGLLDTGLHLGWWHPDEPEGCKIADVIVEREGTGQWSRISDGGLEMQAILLTLTLTAFKRDPEAPPQVNERHFVDVREHFSDGSHLADSNAPTGSQRGITRGLLWEDHCFYEDEEAWHRMLDRATVMLIGRRRPSEHDVCGLLLDPVEDARYELPSYRRIGWLAWTIKEKYDDWPGRIVPPKNFRFV